ncbi:unnamed protein product [Gadus morhua 'NCC']
MDGKLTPPDLMEKTMVMSDVNEDRSPERRAFLFRARPFCNPLGCLFATLTGRHASTLSRCSYLCGCQPSTLEPQLNTADCCSCLVVHCCCPSDCNGCSVCLPAATECIDLAMEFSQMVFH